jgi:hypothetical protein
LRCFKNPACHNNDKQIVIGKGYILDCAVQQKVLYHSAAPIS